jgi:hypothetical protein
MNALERINYFEQLWKKFLPDIPVPRASDIDWSNCPVRIVEETLHAVAKRFYQNGLEFQNKRHAYNYVAKVCRLKWTDAIDKSQAAQRAIDQACSNEEYVLVETE